MFHIITATNLNDKKKYSVTFKKLEIQRDLNSHFNLALCIARVELMNK